MFKLYENYKVVGIRSGKILKYKIQKGYWVKVYNN